MNLAETFAATPHTRDAWISAYGALAGHTATGPHGVRLVDVDDDRLVLEMPIGEHARQPFGLLHGGVSLLLAEDAASMHACWGVDLGRVVPVGVEIAGSHLGSARDGTVRATAQVVRRGRTLIRHRVLIEHVESGALLCDARVTNLYKALSASG